VITIVDDDDSFRDATTRLVRSLGYKAESFASAEEFLKSSYVDSSSCLILDVSMPGESGIGLQDRLSDQGNRTPIIFVTASAPETVRAQALKGGAVGFLKKPFREEILINHLDAALTGRKGPSTSN
jgi:FixJ family two-component response regulator